MKTSLTNELIREVLNVNVQTKIHKDDLCSDNILIYWEFDGYHNKCRNINIYELANKCKQWASTHNYSVMSGWEMTHWGGAYRVDVYRNSNNILFSMSTVETEPDAIFEACEWIRNKLKG